MDRRLPIQPGPYLAHQARRRLVVEQRLDMIGRPQSQRYFNPPCCAEDTWTLATHADIPFTSGSHYWDADIGGAVTSFTVSCDVSTEDLTVVLVAGEFTAASCTVPAGDTSATATDPGWFGWSDSYSLQFVCYDVPTPYTGVSAVATIVGTHADVDVPWPPSA